MAVARGSALGLSLLLACNLLEVSVHGTSAVQNWFCDLTPVPQPAAMALMALHRDELDPETVEETLGCVFKDNRDILKLRGRATNLIVSEISRAAEDQLPSCSTAIAQRLQKELSPGEL